MTYVIAIIAPGAMGSGVGARLRAHGVRVLTSLEGRSAASAKRAEAAGMEAVADAAIVAEADLILSVVPPGEAFELAERFSEVFAAVGDPPPFIDCNAVSVSTVRKINEVMTASGAQFVDGGIIGGPPKGDAPGPTFYVAGDLTGGVADGLAQLEHAGIIVKKLEGKVGAASALKLSYAGITKGLVALGTAMILAAERAGTGEALKAELAASQPELLARLSKTIPDMYPKAYRWVDEMRAIADFVGKGYPEAWFFNGAAELYQRFAEDFAGDGKERGAVERFFGA